MADQSHRRAPCADGGRGGRPLLGAMGIVGGGSAIVG